MDILASSELNLGFDTIPHKDSQLMNEVNTRYKSNTFTNNGRSEQLKNNTRETVRINKYDRVAAASTLTSHAVTSNADISSLGFM